MLGPSHHHILPYILNKPESTPHFMGYLRIAPALTCLIPLYA